MDYALIIYHLPGPPDPPEPLSGYDMDYTLIHYDVNAWEGRAYEYGLESLRQQGIPVEGLHFDPNLVIRGLIMDKDFGNLIKVDRFGYVPQTCPHPLTPLTTPLTPALTPLTPRSFTYNNNNNKPFTPECAHQSLCSHHDHPVCITMAVVSEVTASSIHFYSLIYLLCVAYSVGALKVPSGCPQGALAITLAYE